jgi:hypothetical protein
MQSLKDIFSETKPEPPKILLNAIPYIINKVSEYLLLNNDNSLEQRISRYNITSNLEASEIETNTPINYFVKTIKNKSVKDDIRDYIIQEWITRKLILTKKLILGKYNKSKHFAILYGNNRYSATLFSDKKNQDTTFSKYTEKCEKSLSDNTSSLINLKVNNDNLIINMLYQAFICIATYHNMVNFVFENITIDNFLVQTNDYNGYYHYIYNDKVFYIKSCKYNIIINDFGKSQFIDIDDDDSKKMILQNYIDVVQIFQVKFKLQISELESNIPAINIAINKIKTYLQTINLQTTPFSFDNIIETVFNIIKVEAKDNPIYITDTKISILNSQTPFIISKQVDEDEEEEKSKLLLIKTINKAVLTEKEKSLKRDPYQKYMLYRQGLRIGVEAFVKEREKYLKLVESFEKIRKIEANSAQISQENKNILGDINTLLSKMDNAKIVVLKKYDSQDHIKFQEFIKSKILEIEEDLNTFSALLETLPLEALSKTLPPEPSGGNPPKYKSTGKAVYILYKKKKYKRTIYVKDKRKTKYCKINNEYILLSKLKVLQGTLM